MVSCDYQFPVGSAMQKAVLEGIFILSSCWGGRFVKVNHLLKMKFMKTTIFLITLGLVSTTTFAQQSDVKVAQNTTVSSTIKTEKTDAKATVAQNAEAAAKTTAGEAAKEGTKIAQSTKSTAENRLNQAGSKTKNAVNNTDVSVAVRTTSSADVNDSKALSVGNNSDVTLQKNIKGADVGKTEQKVESDGTNTLQKTNSNMKAVSARSQSTLKSNTNAISAKAVSTKSSITTAVKPKPVNASTHIKAIAVVK